MKPLKFIWNRIIFPILTGNQRVTLPGELITEVERTSPFLGINLNDIVKGLLVAVLSGVLTLISESIVGGQIVVNWNDIKGVAIMSGCAYLLKNLGTPSKQVLKMIAFFVLLSVSAFGQNNITVKSAQFWNADSTTVRNSANIDSIMGRNTGWLYYNSGARKFRAGIATPDSVKWYDLLNTSSGGGSNPADTVIGRLFNYDFATTTDFTLVGAPTFAIVGSELRVSGGNTGNQADFTRYGKYNQYTTGLDKWTLPVTYTIDTYNATSFGVGFGIQTTTNSPAGGFSFQWFLDTSNSGTGGRIYSYYNNTTNVLNSAGTLPIALNDTIQHTATLNENIITITYENITQHRSVSLSYEFKLSPGTTIFMPNIGQFTIYAKGGSNDISLFSGYSFAPANPDYLGFGDSIMKGYYAGNESNASYRL